jgi:hypothetical protein
MPLLIVIIIMIMILAGDQKRSPENGSVEEERTTAGRDW